MQPVHFHRKGERSEVNLKVLMRQSCRRSYSIPPESKALDMKERSDRRIYPRTGVQLPFMLRVPKEPIASPTMTQQMRRCDRVKRLSSKR